MIESDLKEESEVLVRFKQLTKRFGHFTAVSNLNLEIYKGEILGFLGPNGAGKSTTMKMFAGLLKPSEGEIYIKTNAHLAKMDRKNQEALLDNIGFLIENPSFYDDTTPRKILTYFALLRGYPLSKVKTRVEEVVSMMKLDDWIDKKMGTFSKGMRQKIGILSAIVHDPDTVVLDEPYTGLDPKARKEVRDFILSIKNRGKTIFLSSHLLYEVSEVADRVAIISHGKLIACDTLERLESIMKKSLIEIELLNMPKNAKNKNELLTLTENLVGDLTGIPKEKRIINFLEDKNILEILFDGDPENQVSILRKLMDAQYPILEYAVPKAGLLENLYLDLIQQDDDTSLNSQEEKKNNKYRKKMVEKSGDLRKYADIYTTHKQPVIKSIKNESKLEGKY